MKKLLVLSRKTGQSEAFKKAALDYVNKNKLEISWEFSDEKQYVEVIEKENYDCVLISPELMVVESKIKSVCEDKNIKCMAVNPADFGLRRLENIMKAVNKAL